MKKPINITENTYHALVLSVIRRNLLKLHCYNKRQIDSYMNKMEIRIHRIECLDDFTDKRCPYYLRSRKDSFNNSCVSCIHLLHPASKAHWWIPEPKCALWNISFNHFYKHLTHEITHLNKQFIVMENDTKSIHI